MSTPPSDAEAARDRFFERTRRPVQLLVAASSVLGLLAVIEAAVWASDGGYWAVLVVALAAGAGASVLMARRVAATVPRPGQRRSPFVWMAPVVGILAALSVRGANSPARVAVFAFGGAFLLLLPLPMRAVRRRLWNHPELIVAAQAGRASQTESAEPAESGLPSNQP
jgi:hypothetical protein